jgi:phage portal protein BeeE
MRLWPARKTELERADPAISFQSWVELITAFSYNGVSYTLPNAEQEEIRDYTSVVRAAYKSCGVVFACMDVRAKLFSEARFQYRRFKNGRPQAMFGDQSLGILEQPWQAGTTGDLLYQMIQHVDLAGNAFVARQPGGVAILRPDWVDIVGGSLKNAADDSTVPDGMSSVWAVGAQVAGYVYHPGGRESKQPKVAFLASQVAHWAPIPDPEARWRGMSWLTPVLREVMADKAATLHKLTYFQNGATPNLMVKFDVDAVEKMRPWIELFREQHEGAANAYKTLFLGAGTDATVVGANPEQIDFKVTQGAGETRIAAAAGVPPVIVGLSEGLQAATYSNYSQARRRFADQTMRPLWRNACGSLEPILNVPGGAQLWYDDRDIPALKEDIQDKAKEMQEMATAANQLVSAGYDPDSIVAALDAGDLSLLTHSGLVSVQLQPPGKDTVADPGVPKVEPVPVNGTTPVPA